MKAFILVKTAILFQKDEIRPEFIPEKNVHSLVVLQTDYRMTLKLFYESRQLSTINFCSTIFKQ